MLACRLGQYQPDASLFDSASAPAGPGGVGRLDRHGAKGVVAIMPGPSMQRRGRTLFRDHMFIPNGHPLRCCRVREAPRYTAVNNDIPRLYGIPEKPLANRARGDAASCMIRPGFLDSESRCDLIELARDGSAAHQLARRANALVLLDDGMSCEAISKVLFSTTIRSGPGTNSIRRTGSRV